MVALFDVAAREAEKRDVAAVSGAHGVRDFLARLVAQQIPADTLAEQGVRGASVRLLTAHRSKGLEWDLVVVAHVQQDGWPDLRRRSTMLQADRIGPTASWRARPAVTARELLQEERRLFYVACTRARSRLVVTAVASAEDDGEQPSRFLAELGVTVEKVEGRPAAPALAGRPGERAAPHRRRPRHRPRRCAPPPRDDSPASRGETVGDRPLVPAGRPVVLVGHPRRDPVGAAGARPRPARPVSASMLEAVMVCPTRWFLTTEAGGAGAAHQSANIGQLVHALAQRVAAGEVGARPRPADAPRRRGVGPAALPHARGRPPASTTGSRSR